MTILPPQITIEEEPEDLDSLDGEVNLEEPLDALKECLEAWIGYYYKDRHVPIADDEEESEDPNDVVNNNEPATTDPPLPADPPPSPPPLPDSEVIKTSLSERFDDHEPEADAESQIQNSLSESFDDYEPADAVDDPTPACSTPKQPHFRNVSFAEVSAVAENVKDLTPILNNHPPSEKSIPVIILGDTMDSSSSTPSGGFADFAVNEESSKRDVNYNENPDWSDNDFVEILEESNVFTERRPTRNIELVNADQEEMNDINDPRWDKVRNLKTDDERKRFAMESFGNREPANPAVNLSYHGYLRARLRAVNGHKEKSIEAMADSRADLIRIKSGVVEILDREAYDYSSRPYKAKKRKASSEHEEAPKAKRRMISIGNFKRYVENVAVRYQEKRVRRKSDLKYFIRHWRKGMDESTSFFKYFEENQDNNICEVDEHEVKKVEAMEDIYSQFTNYYGLTETTLCKDCTFRDRQNVYHSM